MLVLNHDDKKVYSFELVFQEWRWGWLKGSGDGDGVGLDDGDDGDDGVSYSAIGTGIVDGH